MNRSLLRLPKILFPTVLLALSLSPIAVDADEGPILDEATALAQCAATIPAPTITILPAPGVDADDSVDGAMECVDNFDPCTSTTLPVCIEDTLCQLGHDIDEGLRAPATPAG